MTERFTLLERTLIEMQGEIERLESRLRDRQNALDHAIDYGHRMDDKIKRLRAALEEIEKRACPASCDNIAREALSYEHS